MNSMKSNEKKGLSGAIGKLCIKTGEVGVGKCLPGMLYEPKVPMNLLKKTK